MQIKSFSVFKNTQKKSEKEPDYSISINTGTKEQPAFNTIGGGWIKEGAKGKFISFQLSDPYKDRKGYHIEVDGVEKTPDEQLDEMATKDESIPF